MNGPILSQEQTYTNLDLTVDSAELQRRTNICLSCEYYSPQHYEDREIINATTGQPEIVSVFFYEDCAIDNVLLGPYLTFKSSYCPIGKW
jgi:hypothetical protein